MRYVCSAIGVALSVLVFTGYPPEAHAQDTSNLSVTNYQLVAQQAITATLSNFTYSVTLVNAGPQSFGSVIGTASTSSFNVRSVPGQNQVTFTPVPPNSRVPGGNTFSVLVDQTQPLDIAASVQWTFQTAAAPPVANAGPNQTGKVGGTVMLNGSGSSNPSGIGTLTYNWNFLSRPVGSVATLSFTSVVNPSFVVDVAGTYVIQLTVSNGVASASANVLVSTNNSAPVAMAGPNQTVAAGSTVVLNGSASSDVDGDPLTFHWALIALPAGSAATLHGSDSVSPSFVVDKPGTYMAQLVVNDGIFNSNPSTVKITTGNTAPVANAGPNQVVVTGTLVQLNGSGSTDVDGDPLTYHWTLIHLPAGSTAVPSDPTGVNPTFTADLAGTYVAQLIVNDGTVNSPAATVTITTNAVQAPTANAGANQTVGEGTTVILNGSGMDSQGQNLTFKWSLTTKPLGSTAILSSAEVASPILVADRPGTYIAQLIVNNGFLDSAPSTVVITTTNTPPVANAGADQNVGVGVTVMLDGSDSSDADHDPLSYSWSLLSRPNGSSATLLAANSSSPTFVADLAGTYVAQLIVNSGFVNSTPTTVVITAAKTAIQLTPSIGGSARGTLAPILPATTSMPSLSLSSNNLNFGISGTMITSPQTIILSIIGGAGTSWTASSNQSNITLSAISGVGDATLQVTATSGPSGVVTISAPGVVNSPQQIQVNIATVTPGQSYGSFDTPANNAAGLAGNIPVTGWALDNIEVTSVGIYREPVLNEPTQANGLVFIGNSTLVVGARPDVVATYPRAPLNYRAGWGYMLLTNFLPNRGNGTYTLHAIVLNQAGIQSDLGARTITVDNAHAAKPFGTIDTPGQGESISGNAYVNFGWALTQNPYAIPTDGSTITVFLDGVPVGHPVYNQFRSDIATLFPGLANSNGAVGFFMIDTTQLANGVHTISWSVTDNGGRTDGIGSRYFTVANTANVPGPPASITAISGSGQSALVTTAFGAPLKALVKDAHNNPVPGKTVTFTGPGALASIVTATSVTDSTGVATATVTANGIAGGPYTVNGTVAGVAAGVVYSLTNLPRPPATVLATGGTGQSTTVSTVFPAPLSVIVKDAVGTPVSGASVTFSGPASGAGIASTTVLTNSLGIATASVTANATAGGPYTVTASVTGATPATFTLTNTPVVSGGGIAVTSATVGQNLEANITVTLPTAAPSGGAMVTLTSSDPTKLLLGGPNTAGATSQMFTIAEGSTTATGINAQALASSGTATITATAPNFTSGSGTITFSPSGVVLAGPNGVGVQSFSTNQGLGTAVTVSLARLDSLLNFVQVQPLRGGASANVTVQSSNTSVGTLSSSPVTFNGGDQSVSTQFNAILSGSTTLTAVVPAGFNIPAAGANTLTVAVNPAGLVPPAVTVGQGLEVNASVALNGVAPGAGLTVSITSNDPSKLLFSKTPTDPGSASINVLVPGGLDRTPDFYVYGLASVGTPTYAASASGFGTVTGTVTLAPSGFVIQGLGPIGTANFLTTTGAPSTAINVWSALLDSSRNFVSTQAVAGAASVNVNVSSSDPSKGTITTSPVMIAGGSLLATTQFQPAAPGNTTLSVGTPAGFSKPAQDTSIVANVITPGIGLPPDGTLFIGQKLQQQVSFSLGQLAPAGGVMVTLTSNSSGQLLLSKALTTVATPSITINVAAGTNSGSFYMTSLANSGTPTYTASAPGYATRTSSVTLTASGAVIAPPLGLGTPFLNTTVAAGVSPITVSMAQLNPDNTFSQIQQVAAGQSVTVNLTNSNASTGTIAGSVVVPGGSDTVATNFTPVHTGSTTVAVVTAATNDKSIAVTVQ